MKEIPLTRGYAAIVDDADCELVSQFNWQAMCPMRGKDGTVYAVRCLPITGGEKQKHQLLHRMLLGVTDQAVLVDHVNGNGLDNRRANLRVCTTAENGANRRGAQRNSKAGIRGVCWDRRRKKWKAQIGVKGKCLWLGRFDSQEAAARAYADAAKEYFGEFASAVKHE